MSTPYPLGRLQRHDERSRAFALQAVKLPARRVLHERFVPIWDQGSIGSCTANAALGMICTGTLNAGHAFTEADAVQLYREETRLDDAEIPGHYEPDDTGSAGIYSCKALQARGLISAYRHAFSVTTALGWLGIQPISIGVPWFNSMFEPAKRTGLLTVDKRSGEAGGHQVCLDGIDPAKSLVRLCNSWTDQWGQGGRAWLRYEDLDWLLRRGGDAVTVTLAARP